MMLTVAASLTVADRPKILGIINFVTRVDNLEAARRFYTGVVGMDEAFTRTLKQMELACTDSARECRRSSAGE